MVASVMDVADDGLATVVDGDMLVVLTVGSLLERYLLSASSWAAKVRASFWRPVGESNARAISIT